jgi:predicted enzyme related to lactoylglutathione lyase
MTSGLKTIVYPVKDLAAAKSLYGRLLGVKPTVDQPYYVGYDVGDQHIGLDPNGHAQGSTGPVSYWHVDDIAATVASLVAAGATVAQPAKDFGGKVVGTLIDSDGNLIGLIQQGEWQG